MEGLSGSSGGLRVRAWRLCAGGATRSLPSAADAAAALGPATSGVSLALSSPGRAGSLGRDQDAQATIAKLNAEVTRLQVRVLG